MATELSSFGWNRMQGIFYWWRPTQFVLLYIVQLMVIYYEYANMANT